jgi:glutathione synthase/RimK-type ligase-like ATP-grasp enzyme
MTDKWLFHELMIEKGIPTIPTRLVETRTQGVAALGGFGTPCVFKNPIGTEGDEVFVVSSVGQFDDQVMTRLGELGGRVIAQPFVESRIDHRIEPAILKCIGAQSIGMRSDIRVMTVVTPDAAPAVVACFMRVAASPQQHVNNVAKGAREVQISFTDLHPVDQETLHRAVYAMPDAHIVGWDLIGHPGERVVMEANSGPGLPDMITDAAIDRVLGPCARLMHSLCSTTSAADPVGASSGL